MRPILPITALLFTFGCAPDVGPDAAFDDLQRQLEQANTAITALQDHLNTLDESCTATQSMTEQIADNTTQTADLQNALGEIQAQVQEHNHSLASLDAMQTSAIERILTLEMTTLTGEDAEVFLFKDTVTNRRIDDLILEVTGQGITVAAQQSMLTSLRADLNAQSTDLNTILSDYVTQSSIEDTQILTDTTWTVGLTGSEDYSNLNDAVAASTGYSIAPGASLTLTVSAGVYAMTEPLHIAHPDGARLFLQGDPDYPETVVLSFSGALATAGLSLTDGHTLAGFNGFTIKSDGVAYGQGIYVRRNALLHIDNTLVDGWAGSGIYLTHNSTLYSRVTGSLQSNNNDVHGLVAVFGSTVRAQGLTANNNGNGGVHSMWNSFIDVRNGQMNNNGNAGVGATWGGTLYATGSEANNNTVGFRVHYNGALYASETLAKNNSGYGYKASANATLYAKTSAAKNNPTAYYLGSVAYVNASANTSSGNTVYSNVTGDASYSRVFVD